MKRPREPQGTRNNTQTVSYHAGTVAVCILLAATLLACTGGGGDSSRDERVLELEAKAHSLEESLEALADENAELKGEIAILRERLGRSGRAASGTRGSRLQSGVLR